jgi:hypothetical protein
MAPLRARPGMITPEVRATGVTVYKMTGDSMQPIE